MSQFTSVDAHRSMSKHYTSLLYHIVFATKYRRSIISEPIESAVWEALQETCAERGLHVYGIGGHENHVHVLVGIPPDISVADAVRMIKSISTRKIRERISQLANFRWQAGYSAFTFDRRALGILQSYVKNQRKHHTEPGAKAPG